MELTYIFHSKIRLGPRLYPELPSIDDVDQNIIKNEPMLFSCDLNNSMKLGGPLTLEFLSKLLLCPDWNREKDNIIIDSRVHMLMKGWYPCIPGFHHDDVPRDTKDGQPNYHHPSYKAKHCMCIVGDCSKTEFALGNQPFPEIEPGQVYYKVWHPIVKDYLERGGLESKFAESGFLYCFDWNTWHQGTVATKSGWRWFIRASMNTNRKPTNELRQQVQVYLPHPMEGW
jgi:hypothetical protein